MRRLPALLLFLVFLAPAGAQENDESPPDPKKRFWEARQVMLKGDAKSAAELFRVLVKDHPKSEFTDDSLYWMGRCNLRVKDREPDAVVAFLRVIREHEKSPFLDDAARELMRLGDKTVVPELRKRLAKGGDGAELTAKALAEFDDEAGIEWLMDRDGESREPPGSREPRDPAPPAKTAAEPDPDELTKLRDEIRRLKKEVEENLALLKKLLEEKAREKNAGETEDGK